MNAVSPLFPALASSPGAREDAALAASFNSYGYNVVGDLAYDDAMVFEFFRADGSCERYTAVDMRRLTWWYWLPERASLSIEANLFPLPMTEARVHYVARTDNGAGGKLIRGSRLSGFFDGDAGRDAAYAERERLLQAHPDAGVFGSTSIADAERYLAAEDAAAEGLAETKLEMAAARAKRFASLLS